MRMVNAVGDRLLRLVLPNTAVSAAETQDCWDTGRSCGVQKTWFCCSSGNCCCVCHC